MRFKDEKDAQKILAKVPGPWVPGYWAMMRGTQKRRDRLANQSKAAKKFREMLESNVQQTPTGSI